LIYQINSMEESKKEIKKPPGKYDDKLKVNGSFLDLMKAAAKDTNAKAKEPKEAGKKKSPKV